MQRLPIARALLFAAALAGACVLPGCKRAGDAIAETAIEQASGDKVDIDHGDGTVNIKTGQGEVAAITDQDGGSVSLPAGFPSDVFLPAPRTISSAMDMGGTQAVNLVTSASLAQVSAEVEKAMQAQGWKRDMAMQADAGSTTLVYSKDRRQTVYQLVKAADGGSQLAVRTGGDG